MIQKSFNNNSREVVFSIPESGFVTLGFDRRKKFEGLSKKNAVGREHIYPTEIDHN